MKKYSKKIKGTKKIYIGRAGWPLRLRKSVFRRSGKRCPSLDILSGRTEGVRAAPEMSLID